MEKLSIYEYVAVIVPGVVFLFGLGSMLPGEHLLHAVLLPRDMGTATVHLFLAFALGHMLQVIGQVAHRHYWADFGGLPTDWPFTRQHHELSPELQHIVMQAAGQRQVIDVMQWRRAVGTARSLVIANGFGGRLEVFIANYGMFRSLVIASALLLFAAPWCNVDVWKSCPIIGGVLVVSAMGMHTFGMHYARELFAAARAWGTSQRSAAPADSEDEAPRILKIRPRRVARRQDAA